MLECLVGALAARPTTQLPTNALGGEQVMALVLGTLLPVVKTLLKLQAPGFSLTHTWMLKGSICRVYQQLQDLANYLSAFPEMKIKK